MTDPTPEAAQPAGAPSRLLDFSDLPPGPLDHFKLCWFGAVIGVLRCAFETFGVEAVKKDFPFVEDYVSQLARRGVSASEPGCAARWWPSVEAWESRAARHLPLRAVRLAAELGWSAVGALIAAGLHEEDPRFGALFSAMQGGVTGAPTVGFLNACWSDGQRGPVRQLQEWGFLTVFPGNEGRHTWLVQVPVWLWDIVTDAPERLSGPGFTFEPPRADAEPDDSVEYSDEVRAAHKSLPALVGRRAVDCVVVRGPHASGRRSVVQKLASALGRGVLSFSPPLTATDARWALLGPLATVLGALPVAEFELAPGEAVHVPVLGEFPRPLALVLGRRGGVTGPGAERAVTLELDVPPRERRRALWQRFLPGAEPALHDALTERHRMPTGRLAALGKQAAALAALHGRETPLLADFAACARTLHTEAMGSLATALPAGGRSDDLALSSDLVNELRAVEARCRHRERLAVENHRFAPNVGVRVLLTGPSGTGKTLAVRVLGAALGRDVFRVELAAVVNKYIGETEKNLDRVLSLAEELDIVLLFDEGDALLARRTAVQSSTDRYANLETNFLLQRLESFEGIVFVTTNAGERVDPAFQRRMDAVVELRAPETDERRRLWELHLPDANSVGAALLDRVAAQCQLTGGQIRNASVHARLLALDDGGVVNDDLLATSVRREYRKLGTSCPLRLA